MSPPGPNWWDLIVGVASAAVGWLAAWLKLWSPPRNPFRKE